MKRSLFRLPNTVLAVITLALALFPFMTDSNSTLIMMTHIFIMGVFAMSYDILLGYTGIVSFGHAMFFGIGAYSVAVVMDRFGASVGMLLLALLIASLLAALVSYVVGLLSLRLKSHFYAMLTLAFAGLFMVGAQKWRSLTGGNDGFTFPIPDFLKDRTTYYLISLAFMILIFLLLRRFTQSPVGKVLQAIRENEDRTATLGYVVLHYKVIASIVAGVVAALSGAMHVVTLRFVNTAVFSTEVTLDALLMTIIGGVGTLFGSLIGAGIIELAHDWLTDLAKVHWIFERWLILFGLVYILVVMLFPLGLVGSIRKWWIQLRKKQNG